MKRFSLALLAIGTLIVNVQAQTVIVDEKFDYADEASLHAVWGGFASGTLSPGTPAEVEEQFDLVTESALNSDFNGNTVVDAADYVLWRKNNGLTGGATQPQGDANGDGTVDNMDYDAWKEQFGTTPSGGGGGNKYVLHNANSATAPRLPDGNLVYKPLLDPNFVEPGYPGGDGSIFPSDGLEPIVLRGDIYAESSAIHRNSIGLRYFDGSSVTSNLFELGFYNDATGSTPLPGTAQVPSTPDCSSVATQACAGFGARIQLFPAQPGPNPNWQFFAFDPSWDTNGNGLVSEFEVFAAIGGPGWHRFEATFTADPATDAVDIVMTVDLLRDGINNATGQPGVDSTITINDLVGVSQSGFNSLRIGGPSSLYTTQAARFDNIYLSGPQVAPLGSGSLSAVPEPTTVGLALVAAMGVLVAGRRSRS